MVWPATAAAVRTALARGHREGVMGLVPARPKGADGENSGEQAAPQAIRESQGRGQVEAAGGWRGRESLARAKPVPGRLLGRAGQAEGNTFHPAATERGKRHQGSANRTGVRTGQDSATHVGAQVLKGPSIRAALS